MRKGLLAVFMSACLVAAAAVQAGKPVNFKGLEITPVVIATLNVASLDKQ